VAYGYDASSQLTALRYLNATLSVLAQSDYTYDDKGNRLTRTTTDGVTSYTYDNLDRLTGAAGPDPANPAQSASETYAYDAVGNRTSSHLATGQVHDAANRLLEDSRFTYTYDANGNLSGKTDKTTAAVTTYDWDVEDRLGAVHTPTQTVTFRDDPLGRRIEKAAATPFSPRIRARTVVPRGRDVSPKAAFLGRREIDRRGEGVLSFAALRGTPPEPAPNGMIVDPERGAEHHGAVQRANGGSSWPPARPSMSPSSAAARAATWRRSGPPSSD
jgi:YD repeat-containing protein